MYGAVVVRYSLRGCGRSELMKVILVMALFRVSAGLPGSTPSADRFRDMRTDAS